MAARHDHDDGGERDDAASHSECAERTAAVPLGADRDHGVSGRDQRDGGRERRADASAVVVARPDGADLTGAITSALERPTVLPDAASFARWTAAYIEDRITELHKVLSHILDGKRTRRPAQQQS
jgi:hypothetical protein